MVHLITIRKHELERCKYLLLILLEAEEPRSQGAAEAATNQGATGHTLGNLIN